MQIPAILQGESLTRLLQGIALGAVAAIVIGFNWGGWMTGGSASQQTADASESAVITALAPICVDQFQRADGAVANLATLQEASVYRRDDIVKEGGWATLPGSEKPVAGVAKACAEILNDLKES